MLVNDVDSSPEMYLVPEIASTWTKVVAGWSGLSNSLSHKGIINWAPEVSDRAGDNERMCTKLSSTCCWLISINDKDTVVISIVTSNTYGSDWNGSKATCCGQGLIVMILFPVILYQEPVSTPWCLVLQHFICHIWASLCPCPSVIYEQMGSPG